MDEEITELFKRYDHAWNERNTESYCNLFLEDATAIFFLLDGKKIELSGRQGLIDYYAPSFQSLRSRPGVQHHTQVAVTRTVSPQMALADGEAVITETSPEKESPTTLRRWAVSFFLMKQDTDWGILSLRAFERPLT